MLTDPIADMLTRIRNALAVHKESVNIPKSKIKLNLANLLKKEGYILDVKEEDNQLVLDLKYIDKKPAIKEIKRISKPGQRIYKSYQDIFTPRNGLGIYVVSTPSGIMTHSEARKKKTGGEIICELF